MKGLSLPFLCLAVLMAGLVTLSARGAAPGHPPTADLNLPLFPAESRYVVEPAFPGIPPIISGGMVVPPGETNRLFVLAKRGIVYAITNLSAPNLTTVLDITGRTFDFSESGLVGFTLHPGWRTNHRAFAYYATMLPVAGGGTMLHQRLSEFAIDPENPNRILPESEIPMISQADNHETHNSGDLEFGPDGYLYVSLGDGGSGSDSFINSQRIDLNFFSAILRLDVDQRPGSLLPNPHVSVHPGTYRVPADNPFIGATLYAGKPVKPESVRTEIYAGGFRNPFRITFDPQTGNLLANDVGSSRREEVDVVVAGGNYGWLVFEGTLKWPHAVPPGVEYREPLAEYEHENSRRAITGGAVIRGDAFPDLKDHYLFADFGGDIGAFRIDGDGKRTIRWLATSPGTSDIAWIPEIGQVYLANFTDGVLRKLAYRNRPGPPIPARLSETGVFASLDTLQPAPGLLEYQVNVPFWSDFAHKRRWFGLTEPAEPVTYSELNSWQFPSGSTWVKHFEMEMVRGRPETRRRLETRVLVRNAEGVWGATYRWNAAGTDAELVPIHGLDEDLNIVENGQSRIQKWRYPARSECDVCHNESAGWVLGFNTAQLNRKAGSDLVGASENQLAALIRNGYLKNPPEALAPLPVLAPLENTDWSLEYRIKSYLAVNCSYCHHPGGPTRAIWDASLGTPLSKSRIVNEPSLVNLADIFGSFETFIIKAAKLEQSAIYRRVADMEPYHMPPLGTSELNQAAIAALGDWITDDVPGRQTFAQWQLAHFAAGAPQSVKGPDSDPDGDLLSNEGEFLVGESPIDPVRRWSATIRPEGDRVILSYLRLPNRRFQVQKAVGLPGAEWLPLEHPDNKWFVGALPETVEISIPLGASPEYFRVVVSEP